MGKDSIEEQFAKQLEDIEKERRVSSSKPSGEQKDVRLSELVRISQQLREVWAAEPRPEYKAAARARFFRAIDAAPSEGRLFGLFRQRWLASGVAAAVTVAVISGGVSVASAGALPDEPLYPVKRGIEQARLALTFDDSSRAELILSLADQRLREIEETERRGRPIETGLLQDLAHQTSQVSSDPDRLAPELAKRLADLSERQQATLQRVADKVPASAKPALEKAIEEAGQSRQRATEALEKREQPAPTPNGKEKETPKVTPKGLEKPVTATSVEEKGRLIGTPAPLPTLVKPKSPAVKEKIVVTPTVIPVPTIIPTDKREQDDKGGSGRPSPTASPVLEKQVTPLPRPTVTLPASTPADKRGPNGKEEKGPPEPTIIKLTPHRRRQK